jgi:HEAT repeat protein
MKRVLQRLKGPLEGWDSNFLLKEISRSKGAFRCRLIRELSERKHPEGENCFVAQLKNPEAGIRRAAARGLGLLGSHKAVDNCLKREVCTTVQIELAGAWIRGGGKPELAHEMLHQHSARKLQAHTGIRQPASVLGQDAEGMVKALEELLKEEDSGAEQADPHSNRARQALIVRARKGHPSDLDTFRRVLKSGGRRTEHTAIAALGLHGDPRHIKTLCEFLSEMSVDPGRGFAHRRTSATALGQIGIREAGPALLRALRMEAIDHEGRPGAGLGIQYPVRTNIIWALGEIQDPRAIPALVSLLGDDAGSALGGFYLAAMDALVKIGGAATPALERLARSSNGKASANASGILSALARS